jgi:predicted Zn-dependent peptidase
MTQDNPEDLVHELFTQNFWQPHALGKPILGTPETVSAFTRDTLQSWFKQCYAPNRLVITAAGHLTHAQLVDLVSERFAKLPRAEDGFNDPKPVPSPHISLRTKSELEQVHVCLGVPALPLTDHRRFTVSVMNNILGGGMSSRLFQNIREKQGLAYAVFSELTPYSDAGMMTVYAGTAKETVDQVIDLIVKEFRDLKETLVTEEELRRAKNHLKGSLMLSLESTSSRMSNLARQELYFRRFYSLVEILAGIETVTREEIQAIAREFFRPEQIAVTALGPLNGFTLARSRLAC